MNWDKPCTGPHVGRLVFGRYQCCGALPLPADPDPDHMVADLFAHAAASIADGDRVQAHAYLAASGMSRPQAELLVMFASRAVEESQTALDLLE